MPITRIKNNQITNATIDAGTKLVDASITAGKLGPNLNYASNLTITGNLAVNGTSTTLDTVNTLIEDPILLLAKDQTGTPAFDIGFVGERGSSSNAVFVWKEAVDKFQVGLTTGVGDGSTVTLASFADFQAKDISIVNAALTGNVTTALNASSTITAGTNITATATLQGATVTDGTATIISGAIASATTINASGAITGGTLTDGTLSINAGSIASGVNGTFSGTVQGAIVTATANVNGGNIISNVFNGATPTLGATGTNASVTIAPNGTGTVAMSGKKISGLAAPTAATDGANKAYVDSVAEGLDIKGSCVAGTTAALAAVTYANGTAGVGATLTADANGVLAAIDGVTMVAGERLLVKNQAAALQNGIYVCTSIGAAGAPFILTRATDMDGSPTSEIPGAFTFVQEGSANADNGFVCTTNAPVTMGSTAIVWVQFSGAGQITAGAGLLKTGDVLSVVVDDITTAIVSDAVTVKVSANLTTPNIGVANGTSFTASGAVSGGSLTDGTATITSGAGTGFTTITSTGNITTGQGNVAAGNLTSTLAAVTTLSVTDIISSGSTITVNQASADIDFVVEGNSDANLFRTDAGSDTVLISTATATAGATLKVDSTDSILIPVGTTVQRPGSPATGMIRFNTTLDAFEFYDANSWTTAGSDFTVIASQVFNGNGSATAFTLSEAQTTASCIVSINGVVQLPTTAYAVSNVTLTFTEAPLTGDVIEVRKLTTTQTITFIANAALSASIEALSGAVIEVVGDLNPKVTGTQDLGSATKVWTQANIDSAIFYDGDRSNTVTLSAPTTVSSNVAFKLPAADGSAGQAIVTDASGNLSFAAAGATISSDTATNTNFLLYFAATTSGALTAVKQDSGLLYNPSTGSLSAAVFIGALTGNAATASVATTVTLVATNTTNSAHFPLFSDTATGNENPRTDTGFTYNPSTGTLTSTNFVGVASQAKYADLAEKYASDEAIEAGTVVHFAGEGKVASCDTANHHAVAGIVSTNPAYLMNSEQEGTELAIAGRVPCKVTGVVNAGDLMVSAGNGMAMANNSPAIGTVIGKAIEANEGGDGIIEVLAQMM